MDSGMRPLCFALLGVMLATTGSAQVALNQTDTFQDGTTMSWGGGSSPSNVPTGGPLGTGDKYLQISSTSSSLATFNITRWHGDYLAAGVDRIEADLHNTGPNPLTIRLVLFGTSGDRWSSNTSFSLPVGSAWTHVTFDLVASNFTRTVGTGTFAADMASMDRIMFRHEPTITTGGTPVTGQLGIDNVAGYARVSALSANAINLVIGGPTTGGIPELLSSDNTYFLINPSFTHVRTDPDIRCEFSTVAPPGSFSSVQLTLESSTSALPATAINQKVELFSYPNNAWVSVDSRQATATDATINITLPSNVNQFVDQSTGQMKARVNYKITGNLLSTSWSVKLDYLRWVLNR